jgi:hypothetical protein
LQESYQEVAEQLRRQHRMNQSRLQERETPRAVVTFPSEEATAATHKIPLSLRLKIFVFLGSVMLFSCYLYGGQDVKKGATMAYNDMRTVLHKWEEQEPAVKEAMSYCRQGYQWICNVAEEVAEDNQGNLD